MSITLAAERWYIGRPWRFIADALFRAMHVQSSYIESTDRVENARMSIDLLDGTLEVVIPGTDDGKDIKQDAKFRKEKIGSATVHAGFKAHGELLLERFDVRIERYLDTGNVKRIKLGAHSLGAAALCYIMCKSTALRLASYKNIPVVCFLFGCPPTGDSTFIKLLDANVSFPIFNIRARGDVVTWFTEFFMRFKHAGIVIRIGKGWDLKPDHPISEYVSELRAMHEEAVKEESKPFDGA